MWCNARVKCLFSLQLSYAGFRLIVHRAVHRLVRVTVEGIAKVLIVA